MAAAVTAAKLAIQFTGDTRKLVASLDKVTKQGEKFGDNFERFGIQVENTLGQIARQSTRTNAILLRNNKKVQNSNKKTASTLRKVARTLAGLFIVFKAGQSLFRLLIKGPLQAAIAFEQYEVRLRTLFQSQGAANRALAQFVELANEVPFTVQEIVEAGAVLAGVARRNEEELQKLTVAAANIAAATSLPLQSAAVNLQRAVSAGIGAADLFRERAVRQIVESVTGIGNLLAEPIERQRELILEVFGPGGILGGAAKALTDTLGGQLSILNDRIILVKRAFGEQLAPVVRAFAKALAPAGEEGIFDKIIEKIKDSRELIQGIAFTAISLIPQIIKLILQLVDVISRSIRLVFTGEGFNALADFFVALFDLIDARVKEMGENLRNEFTKLANKLPGPDAPLENVAFQAAARARAQFDVASKAVAKEFNKPTALTPIIKAIGTGLDDVITEITTINAEIAARLRATDKPEELVEPIGKQAIKDQLKLGAAIGKFEAKVARRDDPLTAELRFFDELLITVAKTARTFGAIPPSIRLAQKEGRTLNKEQEKRLKRELRNQEVIRENIEKIKVERNLILDKTNLLKAELPLLKARTAELINSVAAFDEEAGIKFGQRFEKILVEAETNIEAATLKFVKLNEELEAKVRAEPFGGEVGKQFATEIKGALDQLSRGEIPDFAERFANITATALKEALDDTFKELKKALAGTEDKAGLLGEFDFFKDKPNRQAAFLTAAAVGGQLLAGLLKGTETDVSQEAIASAVTSTQAVRGVVAGPTSIGIAQVERGIRDAFVETNGILLGQSDILRQIRDAVAIGGGGGGTDPQALADAIGDAILGSQSASLV